MSTKKPPTSRIPFFPGITANFSLIKWLQGLCLLTSLLLLCLHPARAGSIVIDTGTTGAAIPSTLFGAFFEEINLAGEGGLYGELIRNRSFSNSSNPDFWSTVRGGSAEWVVHSGSWGLDSSVSPGAFQQSDLGTDCRAIYAAPGSNTWKDYTLTLQARKVSGNEGFLIMFNVADTSNWCWWNLGGSGNTRHGFEYATNGVQSTGAKISGSIATGQWYDIKIAISGSTVNCYLNNVLTQSGTLASALGTFGLSTWSTQAEFRNIVVTGSNSQILYQSDFDASGGAAGQMSVVTSNPLNATNVDALKLAMNSGSGSIGAANSGYFGIPIQSGSTYNLSLFASGTDGFTGPLTARLESADGSAIYAQTSFTGVTSNWQKFVANFTPTVSDTNARLVVAIDQPGTVYLDVISLFPQATFNSRKNGLRPDLANTLSAMKPRFLRFPGGCYVEGSSLAKAFRWKKSIGDVSERPGHYGIWGYTSTDGLGYHEYLQLCEDIGAEPVFCINAGISHSDVVALSAMGEYVQDALDAIEYANGDPSTTWGAKRAAAGHPAPFNLNFIEIGNENGGTNYNDRYALFYDAIKAAYPQMRIISCVWGGTATSRPLDLIDEHYYTSASTFQSYATKYDSYSRTGPHIFVGEYAVTSGYGTYGNLSAALGEAAFMTGIERNCDIVTMGSYAPLFANVNMFQWKPDAIYFNNSQSFCTPSYYIQKMFANNLGTVLLPVSSSYAGSIGLSTWNTQAEYRNIVVTGSGGQTLYQSDFAASGTTGWVPNSGTWSVDSSVSPSAFKQSANGTDYRSTYAGAGSNAWSNYTLSLQARKVSGSEGFLILFNVADSSNWFWWNIGGWNNTSHAIEYSLNGTKTAAVKSSGSINSGQWYNIKIALTGSTVNCYLDNVLTQTLSLTQFPKPAYTVASMKESTREIIVKTINPSSSANTATIVLNGALAIAPTSTMTVLSSSNASDENSFSSPTKVAPVESTISTPSTQFTLTLPAYSATILRMQALADSPQGLSITAGNQQAALSWNSAAGATSYTLKRATSVNGPYSVIASGLSDPSYTDTNLKNGTTYYYIVVAVNSAGESSTATAVSGTPALPPISAQELVGPATMVSGSSVRLTVNPSVSGRVYTLQRCGDLQTNSWENIGSPQTGTGSDLIFTDSCDPALGKRFYRVQLSPQ